MKKNKSTQKHSSDTDERPFILCCLKELMETINKWQASMHEREKKKRERERSMEGEALLAEMARDP